MKNILFILALFSMALSACSDEFFSQTVEIDPPPYEKQLSFHVNLSDADSSIRMILGRNFGILETVPNTNDFLVHGGSADLYQDGQKWLSLQPLSQDSSFVLQGVLPHALKHGSTYEIKVEHPDYPKVSASQLMPADLDVDSARVKRNVASGQFGETFDMIEIFLADEPGVKNYYELKVYVRYPIVEYDPGTQTYDTLGFQEYPIYFEEFTDPNMVYGFRESGLIGDQFFDGQAYKLQARVSGGSFLPYVIRVRNITEDFYRWSRSYQAKYNTEDNPLIEPISIFNNLVDGLGIFSVAAEKTFVVQ